MVLGLVSGFLASSLVIVDVSFGRILSFDFCLKKELLTWVSTSVVLLRFCAIVFVLFLKKNKING